MKCPHNKAAIDFEPGFPQKEPNNRIF